LETPTNEAFPNSLPTSRNGLFHYRVTAGKQIDPYLFLGQVHALSVQRTQLCKALPQRFQ
jgi:hypothetical protein